MWNFSSDKYPRLAQRVLVEQTDGCLSFAKLVVHAGATPRFIDDQSIPLKLPVVRWADPVAVRETA